MIAVVGIGADGWAGLGERARAAVLGAPEVIGSVRQLELLPAEVAARRRAWPSPIGPLVEEIVAEPGADRCVLASGDPMLYGIGATLARRLGVQRLEIHPHPSAFALACARLGWPAAEVELVSTVGRPADRLARALAPGRRVIVFGDAGEVARVLAERGYGPSRLVVLEQLGGVEERIGDGVSAAPPHSLHAVAIECRAEPGALVLGRTPGLPDEAFDHDGQLTKRHVRAVTLAALVPLPHQLLWDVGAGSGSISIEWLRAEPTARAVAVEARADRAARARENARRLGVPELEVRVGRAPEALDGLEDPDAVFLGGSVGEARLIDHAMGRLRPGGRIVANAVTLEGERALQQARGQYGGTLTRIAVEHAEPIGRYTAWRPQLGVVQWAARR